MSATQTTQINVALPNDLVRRVDRLLAERHTDAKYKPRERSRSAFIREAVEQHIKQEELMYGHQNRD